MPRYDYVCQACGQEFLNVYLGAGQHPSCAICGGPTEYLWRQSARVHGDDIPGGMTIENLGHQPETFYSWSDWRRRVKELKLVNKVEHKPVPGTDKSPHTQSWNIGPAPGHDPFPSAYGGQPNRSIDAEERRAMTPDGVSRVVTHGI